MNLVRTTVVFCVVFAGLACRDSGAGDGGPASAYGADAVGVTECDDYLAMYEKCVDKAPSENRKVMHENLKRDRAAWKTLADDPGARPGLAQSCQLARGAARAATQAYGCTW